ncbi:MAG: hypothetical protein ABIR84_03775 [Candidatus Nitrotoga sp.]
MIFSNVEIVVNYSAKASISGLTRHISQFISRWVSGGELVAGANAVTIISGLNNRASADWLR